jgi:hypothetical protein
MPISGPVKKNRIPRDDRLGLADSGENRRVAEALTVIHGSSRRPRTIQTS